jgi:protein NRD1
MLTRPDAVAAKQGMDTLQDPAAQSKARQVRMLFFKYPTSVY